MGEVVALELKRAEVDGELVEKGVVLPPPSVEGEEEGQKVGETRPELLAATAAPPPPTLCEGFVAPDSRRPPPFAQPGPTGDGEATHLIGVRCWEWRAGTPHEVYVGGRE